MHVFNSLKESENETNILPLLAGATPLRWHKCLSSFGLNSVFPLSTVLDPPMVARLWWQNELGRVHGEGNTWDPLEKLFCTMKNRMCLFFSPVFRPQGLHEVRSHSVCRDSRSQHLSLTLESQDNPGAKLTGCPCSVCSSYLMLWGPGKKRWLLTWLVFD